ncbi:MAG: GGDEF domain-containing protein [Burkholderiaceae bacterium]|nr:GGDEF domain-containing protein [Burkholderiaceae bacterium]
MSWHRFGDIILSPHHPRRSWVGLCLLAFFMSLCSSVLFVTVAHVRAADNLTLIHWWAGITLSGLFLMTTAVRFGWCDGAHDPALTQPQMLWTLTSGAVIYGLMNEARGLVPGIMTMIFFFGTFSLSVRKILAIGLYTLLAFLTAIGATAYLDTTPFGVMDIAYSLMILILLSGSIAINLRIQRIRQRLVDKRHALARALEQNRELASRDEITGLVNRRTMTERMDQEHRRSLRNGRPLLLALLDIDHFKRVNDTYGHATGDQALKVFAQVVSANVRDTDVVARWGGEEFVLMATETPNHHACELLERIRQAVEKAAIAHAGGTLNITVSIGLAEHLPIDTLEHSLDRADKALYRAKSLGRNRLEVAPAASQEQCAQSVPLGHTTATAAPAAQMPPPHAVSEPPPA